MVQNRAVVAESLLFKEPLLQLRSVTKRFGSVTAVRKVDLEIRRGEFWTIFGPNGAGKSTLLRVVAGLTGPSEGSVSWPGSTMDRSRIGYVSHQSLLYGDLTGLENLLFFARLYALTEPRRRVHELLQQMDLVNASDRPVREYSSGMRQRLSLARALLHDPDLLLLDEPYAGLDQHGGRLLTEILNGLRDEKRTVLLITHSLEGLELASHLLVLNRGEVLLLRPRGDLTRGEFEKLYFELVGS